MIAALGTKPAAEGCGPGGAAGPALMMIDLDRFKAVNDTLGHPIGDAVLRVVAKRLQSVVRPTDLLARLGGDEFVLMALPTPERSDLGPLAARIVDTLGRPYLIDGHLINIGASVGVAVAPADGTEHAELLRSADLALYHAKQSGRGTHVFFAPPMDSRARARRALEIDLRKALALGEFELYYQPQVDLDTHSVVGFEALLRWRHPERGLVSPVEFVPLAEEIGLIVPLGEWVMREACREAMGWPNAVSVAVNVSSHQFSDSARLVDLVARSLAASGLPGSRLEIEITESVLLRDDQAVLETLHRLRGMGVRIAMDDFGTGYSSLSQLHSFPFDKIKIDRSFVKDRGDVASQNAIIRAITALGLSLGISTIAEGVETSDQLRRIRAEGCTSVQGYLFSRPVPANQIQSLLADFAPN
jgi:diguanylate cyclase (GGDEF)-like protein